MQKGEGTSSMTLVLFLAKFGFLEAPPRLESGDSALDIFRAGKNQDEYYINKDIIAQAK